MITLVFLILFIKFTDHLFSHLYCINNKTNVINFYFIYFIIIFFLKFSLFFFVFNNEDNNYIRNTPNFVTSIGFLVAKLNAIPRTFLVSWGNITPSSHNLALAYKQWLSFSYFSSIGAYKSILNKSILNQYILKE